MDPQTGEILALANWPTFNPNAFAQCPTTTRGATAPSRTLYEPGSTFKIVTASAALEQHASSRPTTLIETSPGYITFGPAASRSTTRTTTALIPFTDVIVKSSNVGAIKVGLRLGPQRLGEYVNRFGFGQTLAPGLPRRDRRHRVEPDALNDSALASVSMGYQVGVTPLQMATAASSIANGGISAAARGPRLHQGRPPHRGAAQGAARSDHGRNGRDADRRSWSRSSSAAPRKAAQIPGYTIAGKTGTAAKLVNGHYQKSDYNASFVGFIPSRNPALTILVVIDSPHGERLLPAARSSAPIFKRIAEAALHVSGHRPDDQSRRRRCSSRATTPSRDAAPRQPCSAQPTMLRPSTLARQRRDAGSARPERARGACARCRGSA